MVPYNNSNKFNHAASSVLTSDASSDGHSPEDSGGIRSLAGSLHDDNSDDDNFVDQQLFFVTSYSDFDKLAHGPRGHEGKHTLRVYRFHNDGSLVLLHIAGEKADVINPAFSRFHPR